MELGTTETITHLSQESPEPITGTEPVFSLGAEPESRLSKADIRQSLRASTLDGIFATVFSNIAGGVLLSNFLVGLHANPTEIGMLASIPMLANLMQPLGAYLGDRTPSRHNYCLWIYIPARLGWLLLIVGIALFSSNHIDAHVLIVWTLVILLVTHVMGAFGSASWLSWMAALVPRRLRGRYFSIRNSASNLTCLISIPLAGLGVSLFPKGAIAGYGVVLLIGILAGLLSLAFQWRMTDINPQQQNDLQNAEAQADLIPSLSANGEEKRFDSRTIAPQSAIAAILQDGNFLRFLGYFGVWMFSVNLSAPFFNLYMLDNLAIDVRWVTLYNSLTAGANLIMLIFWGKLADRVGNRFLLLTVGVLVAATPILWLGTGTDALSLWLWLPLLHIVAGGTWAAIDLCNNNIQLGIAPLRNQSSYFAVAAAIAGVSGALGTTAGGFLAQFADYGGLPGLFVLSTGVRFVALLPLVFVQEERRTSVRQLLRALLPLKSQPISTESIDLIH
ncbi:MFS transporter [Myxacorys almedinensis]|uniref:MFS transporter n=1 Tax=Myxacorys almedinensis TaxID=2651157 RepID=UPI0030835F97